MDWYFYTKSGDKIGPMKGSALKDMVRRGIVFPETIIENGNGVKVAAKKVRGLEFSRQEVFVPATPPPQQSTPDTPKVVPSQTPPPDPTPIPSNANLSTAYNDTLNKINTGNVDSHPVQNTDELRGGRSPSGRLVVVEAEPVVYVPTNACSAWFDFFSIRFDGKPAVMAGMFNVNGKPTNPVATADDPTILRIIQEETGDFQYIFFHPGEVNVTFCVGEEVVVRRLKIMEVPVAARMLEEDYGASSFTDVIHQLGFPQEERQLHVAWPNMITEDRILYTPETGGSLYPKHLRYNQYPGLVVSIVNGKVFAVSTFTRTPDIFDREAGSDSQSARFIQHRLKGTKAELIEYAINNLGHIPSEAERAKLIENAIKNHGDIAKALFLEKSLAIPSVASYDSDAAQNRPIRSRTTAIILALFFGAVGGQKFYIGSWLWGLVILFLFIPTVGLFGIVVSIIDIIRFILMTDAKFSTKYLCQTPTSLLYENASETPLPGNFISKFNSDEMDSMDS